MEMQVWKKGIISKEIKKNLQIKYKRDTEMTAVINQKDFLEQDRYLLILF